MTDKVTEALARYRETKGKEINDLLEELQTAIENERAFIEAEIIAQADNGGYQIIIGRDNWPPSRILKALHDRTASDRILYSVRKGLSAFPLAKMKVSVAPHYGHLIFNWDFMPEKRGI